MLIKHYLSGSVIYLLGYLLFAGLISCNTDETMNNPDITFAKDSLEVSNILKLYQDTFDSDYSIAKTYLNNILDFINASDYEYELRSLVLTTIVQKEIHAGNVNLSDSLSKEAILMIPPEDSSRTAYGLLEARAVFFNTIGDRDSATTYYIWASEVASASDYNIGEIVAKANLATIYSYKGRKDESIKTFKEIIEICKENNYTTIEAGVTNNLGNNYMWNKDILLALKCFQRSAELYEKGDDNIGALNPLNNMALIYRDLGMDSLAEDGFRKVIQLAQKYNTYQYLGLAYNNLGSLYTKQERYNEAIHLIRKAYLKQIEGGFLSVFNKNHYYRNLSNIYNNMELYDSALYYATKAIDIYKNSKENEELIEPALLASIAHYGLNNIDSAKYYAEMAYNINPNYHNKSGVVEMLAKTHMKSGEHIKALKFYAELTEDLKDYIDTLTSNNAKDLAYNFEIQQKDKEKILLEKDNELTQLKMANNQSIIKSQKTIITLSIILIVLFGALFIIILVQSKRRKATNVFLKEESGFKSHLLSIVSHDLRSPLISLHSMLNVLKYEPMDDETKDRLTNEILAQTEKSIDLSDNLLSWTREQIKGVKINSEEFNLHTLIDSITDDEISNRKKKAVLFINNIDPKIRIKTDKNIVHLVSRNILSNAFKFTPEGGEIKVSEKFENGELIICVSDTGVGIENENLKKVLNASETLSMTGLRGEKGKGFGLLLCKYFLQKCNGRIWFSSVPGQGSKFCFSIPV